MYEFIGSPFCESAELLSRPDQYSRINRAKSVQLTDIDCMTETAKCKSYEISLDECSCRDFSVRQLPCKHMYALAFALGRIQRVPELRTLQKEVFERRYPLLMDQDRQCLSKILQEMRDTKIPFVFVSANTVSPALFATGLLESIPFSHDLNLVYTLVSANEYIRKSLDECILKLNH